MRRPTNSHGGFGRCSVCGAHPKYLIRALCLACRNPEMSELMHAGVPYMSAYTMTLLLRKSIAVYSRKRPLAIQALLAFLHPVLMENIKVGTDGKGLKLRIKNKRLSWTRRLGWGIKKKPNKRSFIP